MASSYYVARPLYFLTAGLCLGLSAYQIMTTVNKHNPLPALPASPSVAKREPGGAQAPVTRLFSEPLATSEWRIDGMDAEDPRVFDAPPGQLPYQVSGVLSSRDPEKARAILINNHQQFMVSVGETLGETSASIVRIFPDRIILTHQGVYQSLRMTQD